MKPKYFFGIIIAGAILTIGTLFFMRSIQSKNTTPANPPLPIIPKTVVEIPTKTIAPVVKKTVFVTLSATGFTPKVITIAPDTRVTWINKSGVEATINSDPHPTHTNYPPLNLGQFGKKNNLSLIFSKPGSYGYHNHFDSTQTGTIIVE
ncbi:MAG TPA: hypothetical protein VF810_05120 [Patescibacteria group bacterium]